MLHAEHVRMRAALHNAVRVLDIRFELFLWRHIFSAHPGTRRLPGESTVFTSPYTPAGDADGHAARIARINTNRVNARIVGASTKPFFAEGIIPKWTIEFPRIASILGSEQSTGQCAAPHDARLVGPTRCERPYEFQRPIDGHARNRIHFGNVTFGHGRILRRSDFLPRFSTVARPMHFDAEMSVIKRGDQLPVPRVVHHSRAVVAKKTRAADGPFRSAAIQGEQTFPRCYMTACAHDFLSSR